MRRYKINSILGKNFYNRSKSSLREKKVESANVSRNKYRSFRYLKAGKKNFSQVLSQKEKLSDLMSSKKGSRKKYKKSSNYTGLKNRFKF